MSEDNLQSTLGYNNPSKPDMPYPTLRVLFDAGAGALELPIRTLAHGDILSIGRAAGAEGITLCDPRASRQHARISVRSHSVYLTDTSSNGTFVNGDPVSEVVLCDGDLVRIGDSFLVCRYIPHDNGDTSVSRLLGDSPQMRKLRRSLALVAPTDATVLILGESGTGKEEVARSIHELSGRSGPFVAVNCSAIPESLAESQLFGHTAGSFTGARGDHQGHFQQAQGGTLFLDELGELPQRLQPMLLRVLEERAVMPVGSSRTQAVDVRVIAATNVELADAIAAGRFRGDLYARLAEITLKTPALRDRREDILPLLSHGLEPMMPLLSPELVHALLLHPWRYNVRELLKIAKQLRIYGAGRERLTLDLVSERLGYGDAKEPASEGSGMVMRTYTRQTTARIPMVAEVTVQDAPIPTRDELIRLVKEAKGNISQLSRLLGRSRRQVYRYMEMHNINLDDYR